MASFCFGKRIEKKLTLNFETDSFRLTELHQQTIRDFLSSLDEAFTTTFEITGHTDDVGTYRYNDQLSYRRVSSVRDYLNGLGHQARNVNADHKGEYQPKIANTSDENRSLNRRVELMAVYTYFDDVDELNDSLVSNTISKHVIDPRENGLISGPNGINVAIPANSFYHQDGSPVEENIEVTLTEATDFQSFLGHNLTTQSEGRILESGGMLKIDIVTEKGDTVVMDSAQSMAASIPTDSIRQGMQLFVSQNGMEWEARNTSITDSVFGIKMRPYPVHKYSSFCPDPFRPDSSGMPVKPSFPRTPRHPHEPREGSFEPKVPWYNVISKGKIEHRYEVRYKNAMDKYDEKMDRYESRLIRFKLDSLTYQDRLQDYRENLKIWELEVIDERKSYYEEQKKNYASDFHLAEDEFERDVKAWNEEYEQKRLEMLESAGAQLDQMESVNRSQTSKYILTNLNMGWINCDRYINLPPEDKMELSVWDNDTTGELVRLIFPEINSMVAMYADYDEDFYRTNYQVPVTERAIILAYKVENGKPMVFYEEVGEKENVEMIFKTVTFAELKGILAGIQGLREGDETMPSFSAL